MDDGSTSTYIFKRLAKELKLPNLGKKNIVNTVADN